MRYVRGIVKRNIFDKMFQGNAWKVESDLLSKTNEELIEFACGGGAKMGNISIADYYKCHKNITFSREEIIFGSSIQSTHDWKEVKFEWNEVFQVADYGVCQTTIPDIKINSSSTFLMLSLNTSLPYQIFLHDPTIFFLSFNPKAFHRVQIREGFIIICFFPWTSRLFYPAISGHPKKTRKKSISE